VKQSFRHARTVVNDGEHSWMGRIFVRSDLVTYAAAADCLNGIDDEFAHILAGPTAFRNFAQHFFCVTDSDFHLPSLYHFRQNATRCCGV
jgi:hypothetical protein